MTIQHHVPDPRMSAAVCAGGLCFLAGQVPTELSGDISQQTGEVLDAVDRVLVWVDPEYPPARATGGMALARPGMRVEMVAVAARSGV